MQFVDRELYGDFSGIYVIRNKVNGSIYVGQTKQRFVKRFFLHQWKLRNGTHDNKHLQRAFNKYGEDAFEFEVEEIIIGNSTFFNSEEMRIIKKYRLQGTCYNQTDGGDGAKGTKLSEENVRKLAELNRKLNTGKKASEETKERMSKTHKQWHRDHPMSEAQKIKTKHARLAKLNAGENGTQKITPPVVEEIQKLLMAGYKQADVARMFDLSQTNISAIKNGRSWTFVSVEGWDEWRKKCHRATLCQADSMLEGATTIPQGSRCDGETPSSEALGPGRSG